MLYVDGIEVIRLRESECLERKIVALLGGDASLPPSHEAIVAGDQRFEKNKLFGDDDDHAFRPPYGYY
jgi:hypothetical protein